jgi:competence protein ComEC
MRTKLFYVITGIILAWCAWIGYHDVPTPVDFHDGQTITVSGIICARPLETYSYYLVPLCTPQSRIQLRIPKYYGPFDATRSDEITVTGSVKLFSAFESEQGITVHYDRMMHARGYDFELSRARVTTTIPHRNPVEILDDIFYYSRDMLAATIPFPSWALVAGVLLGDQSGFSPRDQDSFRERGITHIIVLSGFNITILSVLIHKLLMRYGRGTALVMTIATIVCFLIVVGPTQSLARASAMTLLILVSRYYGLGSYVGRALVLALVGIGIISPPSLVWDISVHLSFLATAGLLIGAEFLEQKILWWVPSFFELRSSLSSTIAATVAVLPISIFQFGYVSAWSIPVNLAILPMIPILMLLGALTIIIGGITSFVGYPFELLTYLTSLPAWAITRYIFLISGI